MNLLDFKVTEVLTQPEKHSTDFGIYYSVEVMANSWGRIDKHTLTFDSLVEASQVKVGYKFQG